MDPLTLPTQAARLVFCASQTVQAASQFILLDDENDNKNNDMLKRAKTILQRRFVILNQDRPMFRRHLRMTYNSFLTITRQDSTKTVVALEQNASVLAPVLAQFGCQLARRGTRAEKACQSCLARSIRVPHGR